MGGGSSKPTEPSNLNEILRRAMPVQQVVRVVEQERKPKILDKPWRDVMWDGSARTKILKFLKEYKPPVDSVPRARILLIGLVGAGKSSFFNSINSIFRGNITSQAEAGDMGTSLTLKYRTYKVKASRGGPPLAFLLCDTMGLEAAADGGVKTEDIVSILKGYVPDRYQFNPVQEMVTDDCQTCSEMPLQDRIHCVVYVIDATKLAIMPQGMKNKVDEIRKKTKYHEVPLMVLLTKVDKACPLVEKDLKNVYRSCYIKELIDKVHQSLGIPVLNVLPVKNYSHELDLNDTCDILLLTAMQKMLNFADNCFDNWEEDTD
ncbi:interferon-induced protein 44-like [Brienomyrus brachyistius]|uniref:interferon-induced protein 44-like n=1 Tax=Brienomyrus brachyistius TaxID=42636 RepID=UPI0020B2FD46|nr:interferon-induced protein 44-like [Brienomyrus brachyistius]XP_048851291.1 interferon-induced protein 44-like [Brienomyrus brachyistius]XP_048851292.1 interferon-induced protein 44-like [Brienomyrus brachyistius]